MSKFLYTGQPKSLIPRDATHARIDPSVKKIAEGAFEDCRHLEWVELCEGLEEIGSDAFRGCFSLKRVSIPPAVKKIGWGAFYSCEQLEELEICEGVGEICGSAFDECKSLKCVRIPSTIKIIGGWAFEDCKQLEEIELCEGLEQIGKGAFARCESLRHITFPSTLNILGEGALQYCHKLEKVDLHEGLEKIGGTTFYNCRSLQRIIIPSTVKTIGRSAFHDCIQLASVELTGGLAEIRELTFKNCFSLRNISVPYTVKNMGLNALQGCHDLQMLLGTQNEIVNGLKCRLDGLPIHQLCYDQSHRPSQETFEQLRDIFGVMPDQVGASISAKSNLDQKRSNLKRTATQSESGRKSQERCHGATNNDSAGGSAMESGASYSLLNRYNISQDCLGMTPLHILACSTKQNLDLYQFIIDSQPKFLITKDKWGCLPIFYAIWSGCSPEIVRFLIDSQEAAFPDIDLNWDVMLSTLCRGAAPIDVIQKLFEIKHLSFPEQNINWQKAARELIIHCLVRCHSFEKGFPSRWKSMMEAFGESQAHQGLIPSLPKAQQRFFTDLSTTNWQALCEEFVKPLKGWWRTQSTNLSISVFQFLARASISERFNAIVVRKWQKHIKYLVETCSSVLDIDLSTHLDALHSKLVFYELEYPQLKEKASLIELVLWKSKIGESIANQHSNVGPVDGLDELTADMKTQCRINCGAEIIIPNVLPFLIADA